MKTIAVICEFNPFHKGHGYFLSKIRKLSGADYIIAVMSGDFVQRGEPALFNKYIRTEAALKNGCDLVLELPVRYSCASAGGFAEGAVSLISSLNTVDEIWFGSECGDMDKIKAAAEVLNSESDSFKEAIQAYLRQGLSYPSARAMALEKGKSHPENKAGDTSENISDIISSPNNILGVQYCIAASVLSFDLSKMHTLKRIGSSYESSDFEGEYSSASAIRKEYLNYGLSSVKSALPDNCHEIYENIKGGIHLNDFSPILKYRILNSSVEDLCRFADVSEDLARRIKNSENDFLSSESFILKLKSKNYTYTRISRALMAILLGIKKYEPLEFHPYKQVRILGMRSCPSLLHAIGEKGGVSLTSQPYDITDPNYYGTSEASDLYESIYALKYQVPAFKEGTRKLIKL